ncbi:hypothetical protein F4780DRAFT_163992 [Xylariomycetidae sp. FL0641]|nr:hypothetical protein F4780DRAFT_163992 [Xylariomycetidae sp. FL0641]
MPPKHSRDYYADLSLPATASIEDVKKQFRKLALKTHPDRNPGREVEFNEKFQIIQTAHEVLSDPTRKRDYDRSRQASRYPTASGVRGNPWQDAAKNYPPPPTRKNNYARRPTSGAQRYESFTNGMPRSSRHGAKEDDQSRKSTADAWESMRGRNKAPPPTPERPRPSATRDGRASTAGPQVPPRTAYQQQKAQASFGSTRRPGFTPHASGVADEPPVSNKNYSTTRHHPAFNPDANYAPSETDPDENHQDPFRTPSDKADDLSEAMKRKRYSETRQSSPYTTSGGEKTSLFDEGPGLGRTASTRAASQQDIPDSFPGMRTRSASTPKSSNQNAASSADLTGANSSGAANTRFFDRHQPSPAFPNMDAPPSTVPRADVNSMPQADHSNDASMPSAKTAQPNGAGPSVYASQPLKASFFPQYQSHTSSQRPKPDISLAPVGWGPGNAIFGILRARVSSEAYQRCASHPLTPLEELQRSEVARLVENQARFGSELTQERNGASVNKFDSTTSATGTPQACADHIRPSSFNFAAQNGAPSGNVGSQPFPRSSADNINTQFVQDESAAGWQFKAGSPVVDENAPSASPRPRPQSRTRPIRRPTIRTRVPETPSMPSMPDATGPAKQTFEPEVWNEQIGSQHFVPQPTKSASASPTRRAGSRKAKPVKMTAGTAGLVDSDDEEGFPEARRPSSGVGSAAADAMDIDTPPAETVPDTLKIPKANVPRNIPVEPYRADWRAGDVNGVHSKIPDPAPKAEAASGASTQATNPRPASAPSAAHPLKPLNMGSEDSEEFLTNLSDLGNCPPFAQPPTGLKSFDELKRNLPFESKPSEQIPIESHPAPPPRLDFPVVPVAPRLPPTVGVAGLRPNAASFRKYTQDFYTYLERWENFNKKLLLHFSTREAYHHKRKSAMREPWIADTSITDNAQNYLIELEQDEAVHAQWLDAHREHRKRVAEYKEFRERVK